MSDSFSEVISGAESAAESGSAFPEIQCPDAAYDFDPATVEAEVLERLNRWFRNRLPCIAGRREFSKNRYMVSVGGPGRISGILAEFEHRLREGAASACFLAFAPPRCQSQWTAAATFRWLAELMSEVSSVDAASLSSGAPLSFSFTLSCPVTGKVTTFDDFECIAFCPQSSDLADPLYDPLMYAPYPAVNISSDVYAFSLFVRDACLRKFGVEPKQVPDRRALFAFIYDCAERWHIVAAQTIENFSTTVEDRRRCPVHVTSDKMHWIACHQDPAFAENTKAPHIHELPLIYATRICDAWVEHFTHRNSYSAAGLSRAGLLSGELQ